MAVIDFYNIEVQIKAILEAYSDLSGVRVSDPEILPSFDPMGGDGIYIYLENESCPDNIQRIRAGRSTDSYLTFSLWVFAWHSDSVTLASKERNRIRGLVELALMGNRTLNGTVITSWLRGGRFNRLEDNGFWSGAEVILEAHAQAVT